MDWFKTRTFMFSFFFIGILSVPVYLELSRGYQRTKDDKAGVSVNRIDEIEYELTNMDLPMIPLSEQEKHIVSLHKETLKLIGDAEVIRTLADDAEKNNQSIAKIYTEEAMLKELKLSDTQVAALAELYRLDTAAKAKVARSIEKANKVLSQGKQGSRGAAKVTVNGVVHYAVYCDYCISYHISVDKKEYDEISDHRSYADRCEKKNFEWIEAKSDGSIVVKNYPPKRNSSGKHIPEKIAKYLRDEVPPVKFNMTKKQAYAILGKPDEVDKSYRDNKAEVEWEYHYTDKGGWEDTALEVKFTDNLLTEWHSEVEPEDPFIASPSSDNFLDDETPLKKDMTKTQVWEIWGMPYEIRCVQYRDYRKKQIQTT